MGDSEASLKAVEQHTDAGSSIASAPRPDSVLSDSLSMTSDAASSLQGGATARTFKRPGSRLVASRSGMGRASAQSVASLAKGDPGLLRWAARDRPMSSAAAATALVGETSARVTRDAFGGTGGVEARAMHDPGSYAPAFARLWAVGHLSGATLWGRPIAFLAHTALDAASANLYCSSIGGSILHHRQPPRRFGQAPLLKAPSATPLQYVLNGGGGRQRARSRLASRLAATRALVGRGFVSSAATSVRPDSAPDATAATVSASDQTAATAQEAEEDFPAAELTIIQGRGDTVPAGWREGQFEVDEHLPSLPAQVRADALAAGDEVQSRQTHGTEGGDDQGALKSSHRGAENDVTHEVTLQMPFEAEEEGGVSHGHAPPARSDASGAREGGLVLGFDTVHEGEEEVDDDAGSPKHAPLPSPRHRRWASLQAQLNSEAAAVTMTSLARGGSSALGLRTQQARDDDDDDVVELGPLQSLSKGGAALRGWEGVRARFRVGGAAALRPEGTSVILAPQHARSSGGGFFATVQAVRRRQAGVGAAPPSLGPAAVQLLGSSLAQEREHAAAAASLVAQSEAETVEAAEAAAAAATLAAGGSSSDSSSEEGDVPAPLRPRSVVQRARRPGRPLGNASPRKLARMARRAAKQARANMVSGLLDRAVQAAWSVAGHDEADTLGYLQVAGSEQSGSTLVAALATQEPHGGWVPRYYLHIGAQAVSHIRTVQRLPMAATPGPTSRGHDVTKLLFGDSDDDESCKAPQPSSALDVLPSRPRTSDTAGTERAAVLQAATVPEDLSPGDADAKQRQEEAALSKRIVRIGAVAARQGVRGADAGWRPATPADEAAHTAERARRTVLARRNADRVTAGFFNQGAGDDHATRLTSRLSASSLPASEGLAELAVGFDPELVVSPRRPSTGVPRSIIPSKWQPLLLSSCKYDLVYPPLPVEIKAFRKAHPELMAAFSLTELPSSKARGAMVQMAFAGHLQLVSTAGIVPSKKKKRKKGGKPLSKSAVAARARHAHTESSVTLDTTGDFEGADDDATSDAGGSTHRPAGTASVQHSDTHSATGVLSSPMSSYTSRASSRAASSSRASDADDAAEDDALLSVTGDWEEADDGDSLQGDDDDFGDEDDDDGEGHSSLQGRSDAKKRPPRRKPAAAKRKGKGQRRTSMGGTAKRTRRKSTSNKPQSKLDLDDPVHDTTAVPAPPPKAVRNPPLRRKALQDLGDESQASESSASERPGLPELLTSGPSDLDASDFESPRPPPASSKLQWQHPPRRVRHAQPEDEEELSTRPPHTSASNLVPRPPASAAGSAVRAVRTARSGAGDTGGAGAAVTSAASASVDHAVSHSSSSPRATHRTPNRKRSKRLLRSGSRGSFGSRTSGAGGEGEKGRDLLASVGEDLVSYRDVIARLEGDAVCVRASASVSERSVLVANGRSMRMHLLALLESGQWYRELRLALKVGRRYLRTVLPTKKSLVIFDVDDTTLSSVVYMARTHFARHPSASPDWYHCARVPALLPVLEFYHLVLHMGFGVVFLSERPAHAFHQTKEALVRAGFTTFKHLITRPPPEAQVTNEPKGTTASAVKSKAVMRAGQFKLESREALMAQGYDIAAVVGDQDSDFAGGHTGLCIKLPNYLYMEE